MAKKPRIHPGEIKDHRDKSYFEMMCSNPECKRPFYPNKRTAKYCSDNCKQQMYRKRKEKRERLRERGGRKKARKTKYSMSLQIQVYIEDFQDLLPKILDNVKKDHRKKDHIIKVLDNAFTDVGFDLDDLGSRIIFRQLANYVMDVQPFQQKTKLEYSQKLLLRDKIKEEGAIKKRKRILIEVRSWVSDILQDWEKFITQGAKNWKILGGDPKRKKKE